MSSRALDTLMEDVDRRLLAGEYAQAIDLLDDARQEAPASYLILQRLGDLYRTLDRPSDAIEAYEQAIAIAPEPGELWAKKGDALIDDGNGDAAVDAFRRASQLAPTTFTEIDWNLRGDRCYSYEDFETARTLYESGLAVRSNADGWRGLGLTAMASGRIDDAVKAYRKGLGLEPDRAELLNDLGLAYRARGKAVEALELFGKLVTLEPDSPNWWFNFGLVSREQGEFSTAYDAYLHVIKLTPEAADAWLELGLCELELGEGELGLRKALGSFERALGLDPYSFWAWYNAGWVLSELGEYRDALERLDHAIDLDRAESVPWTTKVWVLENMGEIRLAEACVSEMLSVVDDQADALVAKGSLLADWTLDSSEALEVFRRALALKPEDPNIELAIAELLLIAGDHVRSRRTARRLLKLELDEHDHCAMLFIVYAAYVLEGTRSPRRRTAFLEFIDYYRSHFMRDSPKPVKWNYRGLTHAIRTNVMDEERGFLLTMAIDLQLGAIDARLASFFAGEPAPNQPQVAAK